MANIIDQYGIINRVDDAVLVNNVCHNNAPICVV